MIKNDSIIWKNRRYAWFFSLEWWNWSIPLSVSIDYMSANISILCFHLMIRFDYKFLSKV